METETVFCDDLKIWHPRAWFSVVLAWVWLLLPSLAPFNRTRCHQPGMMLTVLPLVWREVNLSSKWFNQVHSAISALVVQVLVHCCEEASNWVVCKNTVPNYPPYTGPQHNTAIKRVQPKCPDTLLSNASSLSENLYRPLAVKFQSVIKIHFLQLSIWNHAQMRVGGGGRRRD